VETIFENVFSAVFFFCRKIIAFRQLLLFLKKEAGPTDAYTIARHVILSAYLWGISIPFLEDFGPFVVIIATLFVTIMVTLFFLKISKGRGFLLAIFNLVFKEKEAVKLIFMGIFDPFLFTVRLRDSHTRVSKGVLLYLLMILSILVASIIWSIFVYFFGDKIKDSFPSLLEWVWQRVGILIIFYVRV
jgi:hypothetical protein